MGSLHIGMEAINDMKKRSKVVLTKYEYLYGLFVKLHVTIDDDPYDEFSIHVDQHGNLSIDSKYQSGWYHDYDLPGDFSFILSRDSEEGARFIADNFIEMYLDNSESNICERMEKKFHT